MVDDAVTQTATTDINDGNDDDGDEANDETMTCHVHNDDFTCTAG